MNTSYLYGLIIPVLSFLLQIWPRFKNRYFGIDTWRHLMYANYVRTHRRFPKEIKDRYLIVGPYGYPPFVVLILSLFKKSFTEKYQLLFSPAFDFIHNYLIFFAALFITGDLFIAVTAQVIASLVPIVVMEASNLNTRGLSYLVFTLSFVPLLYFSLTNEYFWLIVSFFFLVLLFYTHRFALQAYLFNCILFSLIERNPMYTLFFIATFLFVYVTGGSFYKAIFDEHMAHLIFWRKNMHLRFAHQFRGLPEPKKVTDFVQRIFMLSTKNPLIFMVGNNPWILLYVLLVLLLHFQVWPINQLQDNNFIDKLNIWILGSFLASALVLGIKYIRFLGEGNRYVEYGIFPLSTVTAYYISSLYQAYPFYTLLTFAIVCLLLLGMIIYLQVKTILHDRVRSITKPLWEVIHYLNKEGEKVRLAIFPFSLGDAFMYFIRGKVLTSDSITALKELNIWPVMKDPVQKVIKDYKINHILFDTNYITLKELKIRKYKKIKSDGGYVLLRV